MIGDDWDEAAIWAAMLLIGGVMVRKATQQLREAGTRIVARQLLAEVTPVRVLSPYEARRALPRPGDL